MKTLKNYKTFNLPSLTDEQLKEIDKLKKKSDKSIDLKSIPELTDKQIATGHFAYANSLKNKNRYSHYDRRR